MIVYISKYIAEVMFPWGCDIIDDCEIEIAFGLYNIALLFSRHLPRDSTWLLTLHYIKFTCFLVFVCNVARSKATGARFRTEHFYFMSIK